MSKILKSTSKLLDDAISLLETEVQRQTMELTALKRAREALTGTTSAPKVKGRYRTTPTVKLRGKTQKSVFSEIQKRGPCNSAVLEAALGINAKAIYQCMKGMEASGILKNIGRGVFKIK